MKAFVTGGTGFVGSHLVEHLLKLPECDEVLVLVRNKEKWLKGLAMRPWREWLRTYRAHERGGHYLADPGEQDITCEPPLDQLPVADAVRSQAQWLALHGIDDLVAEGRRLWEESAAAPDLRALRMRSRISEAEALVDPAGVGGFDVVEWRGVRGSA